MYTRLEHPYTTECFPDWSQTNYSESYLSSKNWPYSFMVWKRQKFEFHLIFHSQQCKRFCVLEAVVTSCNCFHPLYLDIDGDGARGGKEPCDLANTTTTLCIDEVLNQFTAELRRCPCNQSCYETEYGASVSSSMWPAANYEVGQNVILFK